MATMTMLKTWMLAATPEEQETLAQAAATSRKHLYQVSNAERAFSPAKAALVPFPFFRTFGRNRLLSKV